MRRIEVSKKEDEKEYPKSPIKARGQVKKQLQSTLPKQAESPQDKKLQRGSPLIKQKKFQQYETQKYQDHDKLKNEVNPLRHGYSKLIEVNFEDDDSWMHDKNHEIEEKRDLQFKRMLNIYSKQAAR